MSYLKKWMERHTRRNYYLARVYYELLYWFANIQAKDPIIVYQMGKVGSTTIVRSLQYLRLDNPLFHVHTLTPTGRAGGRSTYKGAFNSQFPRSKHLLVSAYLARELHRDRKDGRWKVITLVRDPLAQNISSFFQVVDTLMPGIRERIDNGDLDANELKELFLSRYTPGSIFNHWFERELKPVLGVDVYAQPFPKSQGYEVYHGDRVEILLIRLESLNVCGPRALSEFVGREGVRLVHDNLGDAKPYSKLYKAFREIVALPKSHVDAIYALPQVRHFYTEEEIEGFKSRYKIEAL